MTAPRQILQQMRWYQWLLAALVLVYLIYIALSYFYLPDKLKDVVQTDVAELLGRDITVQRIAFDPFGLAIDIEQFEMADRPQQPLLGWQRFYANLDVWGSLFGWQLQLTQLELDAPRINIERRAEDFNFSDILARFPAEEKPAVPEEEKTFAIQIDAILIRDGHFQFDDVSGAKPATSALDHVTIGVHNLYLATGDDTLNPFSLQADMPGGGKLDLSGEYRADPVLVHSNIKLDGINLPTFADFIENVVPLRLSKGKLDLQAQVNLAQQQTFQVQVKEGALTVHNLALDDAQRDPPLARVKQISVSGIALDVQQQTVAVATVVVDGLVSHQWLKDGNMRFKHVLAEKTIESNQNLANAEATSSAWTFTLDDAQVQNSAVSFTDFSNGLNATQRVANLNVSAHHISLANDTRIPLQVSANINDGGQLNVNGQVILVPFSLDLHYQLQNLPLAPFNAYIESHSWLQLQRGALSLDGNVALESAEPAPLTLDMNLTLADLKANDTRSGKNILQWKALTVQQLQLDVLQRQITIDSVHVQQPDIGAEIGSDKQINLATLMKPSEEKNPPQASASDETQKPFQVVVNNIGIEQGTTRFRDASIQPAYKTGLYNIEFQLKQLSTNGPTPATFTLTSKVDKYAPFNAQGTLAPLQQQPGFAFKSSLRGLEMPNLSPYTGTFIGYQLQSGKLGLELDYELKQRRLKGKNNVIAKQLYLGEAVASEQAVDAPVALGLALLRDMNGVIDMDVGVSGDLGDPGFSVGGIVLKALMNVIVKAATSPFQLLGSLVGGSEDLGNLEFAAGSSELSAGEQTKLTQLTEALAQRPQLAVNIKGNASTDTDASALQQLRVRDVIAVRRTMAPTDLALATLLNDKANRKALEALNDELALPDEDDREEALLAATPTLKGQNLTQQIYQQMLADVSARQTITTQDLQMLADQRALAIKQFLVESAKLDHSRIQMAKAKKRDLTGRTCVLGLIPG